MREKKIQFIVNNAAFFLSHRLPIAIAARDAGYTVELVTGQAGSELLERPAIEQLSRLQLPHVVMAFRSAGLNPWVEARGLAGVTRAMWRTRPDIVHAVSPKGILYGGLAARLTGVPKLVLAVSGMGSVFTGPATTAKQKWLRAAYSAAAELVYAHPRKRVIAQNPDDRAGIVAAGWARPDEIVLIPGSGVDLQKFDATAEQEVPGLVVLPARIIREKGVVEFVEAARLFRSRGVSARMVLVGTADYQNPSMIQEAEIREWVNEGLVEWWGHCDDMPAVYRQASIVCLPSHREGMPKALLEAAAAGKPVVTTDAPGCRDAIIDGETGLLVPLRDPAALADALAALLIDTALRRQYGAAARRLAERRFGLEAVVARTLEIYETL